MSLIDTNNLGIGKANPDAFERKDYAAGWNSALQAISEAAPTIDPETLPIVRQLREKLATVTAEKDAAQKCIKEIQGARDHQRPAYVVDQILSNWRETDEKKNCSHLRDLR